MANPATVAAGAFSQLANPITAVNFFPSVVGGSTRLTIQAPSSVQDGQEIVIKTVIKITGGTTTNFTPSLYYWNNVNTDLTTTTGDVALLTTTAYAVNSSTAYWCTEAHIWWDKTNGKINGWIAGLSGATGSTLISPVALSNIPVTLSSNGTSGIQFCAGGFFSVSNGSNLMSLMDFSIDKL